MATAVHLVKAIAAGLVGLTICALIFSYVISGLDSYQSRNAFGLSASGVVSLRASLYVGSVVVVLFRGPIFAALAKRGRASWARVMIFGALPGLAVLPFNWPLGLLFLVFGLAVCAFVRLVCGVGPNNSFKPRPLRGLGNGVND